MPTLKKQAISTKRDVLDTCGTVPKPAKASNDGPLVVRCASQPNFSILANI